MTVSSNTSSAKKFPPMGVADERKSSDLASNLTGIKKRNSDVERNKSQEKTESCDQSSTDKSVEHYGNLDRQELNEIVQQ